MTPIIESPRGSKRVSYQCQTSPVSEEAIYDQYSRFSAVSSLGSILVLMTTRNKSKALCFSGAIAAIVMFALWFYRESRHAARGIVSAPINQSAISSMSAANSRSAVPGDPYSAAISQIADTRRMLATVDPSERAAFVAEIEKLDFASVFEIYRLEAERADEDIVKLGAVAIAQGNMMRSKIPPPEILIQIQGFAANSLYTAPERGMLIGALGCAPTRESLEISLDLASTIIDAEPRRTALNAIRYAGVVWSDGRFHEELSPPLERAWRESQDQELLIYTAIAMAEIGASNGVSLLLNSALYDVGRDKLRARAAAGALARATILNPSAVLPLAAILASQPFGSPVSRLASDTLAATGISAAGQALLIRLQNADESVAPLARGYVQNLHTPAMLEIWKSSLNSAVPFRSEKNRARYGPASIDTAKTETEFL
jgi:hypothetical protein